MNWTSELKELRDLLADIYPTQVDCRRVLTDAGVPVANVQFQGKAITDWHSALEEAQRRDRVLNIIAVVRIEYGDNPAIAATLDQMDETLQSDQSAVQEAGAITIPDRQSADGSVQIFLSYAKEDYKVVASVYDRLRALGLKPWMDERDLLPGERWRDVIRTEVQRSDFVTVFLSANSVSKRGFFQSEMRMALNTWQEKLQDDIYLIPALLEPCEVPDNLRDLHPVDLRDDEGWALLLRSFQAGIERLGKRMPDSLLNALLETNQPAPSSRSDETEEVASSEAPAQPEPRHLRPTPNTARLDHKPFYGTSWAIVVGIDDYGRNFPG